MAELNSKHKDRPADFGDLSLIVVAERLEIADIASLDSDFDIYCRYRKGHFNQVFPKHDAKRKSGYVAAP